MSDAATTIGPRPYQQAFMRIHAEFAEMPGLRLSLEQVQRLVGLEGPVCESVLADLVRSGFLSVAADGTYVRASSRSAAQTTAARL